VRKQDLILLSLIFEPREAPADHLGCTYRKSPVFEGLSGKATPALTTSAYTRVE